MASSKSTACFAFLALLLLDVQELLAVEIRNLSVPALVPYGAEESAVTLWCDYDYTDKEKQQLDVKWYFDGHHTPFYQWLPGTDRPPQVIEDRFKAHVDLTYPAKLSSARADQYERHQVLRLVDIDTEMSGSYKCKVSTFEDEDFKQKTMIVYAPPLSVEFSQERISDSKCNLTCSVAGVFPQPAILISWSSADSTDFVASESLLVTENAADGHLWDAVLSLSVDHADLSQETTFACNVILPETDVNVTEEIVYRKDDAGGRADADSLSSDADGADADDGNSASASLHQRPLHPLSLAAVSLLVFTFLTTGQTCAFAALSLGLRPGQQPRS